MKDIFILNGATGTELMKFGYKGVKQSDWILEHPDIYLELQDGYRDCGSDIVYTPTFSTNREKLKLEHDEDRMKEINEKLTKLCLNRNVLAYGNIGPSGIFLPPIGKASEKDLYDIYFEQASILLNSGCNGIAIETMMSKEDVLASVRASFDAIDDLKLKRDNIPIILSCSCNKRGKLLTGIDICEILKLVEPFEITAFGVNCCEPELALEQIKRIHKLTNLPLLAKPNAGLPVRRGSQIIYDCSPEEFASYVPKFLENGVKYIGGCCGTTKQHIKKIKEIVG